MKSFWIARDLKDGPHWMYSHKPIKKEDGSYESSEGQMDFVDYMMKPHFGLELKPGECAEFNLKESVDQTVMSVRKR